MKIVLFIAMSLNGIIASKSGSEDFLSDINWVAFSKIAKNMVVSSLAGKPMK